MVVDELGGGCWVIWRGGNALGGGGFVCIVRIMFLGLGRDGGEGVRGSYPA